MYDWVSCVVNFKGHGATTLRSKTGPVGAKAYEVGYRDKYAATVSIDVFKENDKISMTYILYNAFPMGMPPIPLNWNNSDVLRLNIPFAYTDYEVKYGSTSN